jgi:transposase InsO family protein
MKKQIIDIVKKRRKRQKRLGSVKVYGELKPLLMSAGIKCGRDKFLAILRDENMLIRYRKRFVKTTNSKHKLKKYPNLIMDLDINRAEQVFVSDITYIRTKQGFLHLFLVTDAYSKQIMGWELSDNQKTENAIKALKMAINNRQYPQRELIHHSDRGFQYCNPVYIELQKDNGIMPSMTTKYDPYENAIAERVNGILKTEYEIGDGFLGQKDAKREIKYAIWLYNTDRPHMSCHGLTPVVAHKVENYKMKKWSRKFVTRDMSLVTN